MDDNNKKKISLSLSGWRTVEKKSTAKNVQQSSTGRENVLPTHNRFQILDELKDESEQLSESEDEQPEEQQCCREWKLKCLKLEQENKGLKKQQHEQKLDWKAKNLKLQKEIDDLKKQIEVSKAAQSFDNANSPPPPVQTADSFQGSFLSSISFSLTAFSVAVYIIHMIRVFFLTL